MPTLTKNIINKKSLAGENKIRRLFDVSLKMVDILEDILEDNAQYSDKFIRDLKKSLNEKKKKKIKTVNSLSEIL